MSTITLYAGKINQLPGLIKDVKAAVSDYKEDLFKLQNKSLTINKSVCDLDEVVNSIKASTKTQEDKIVSLDTLKSQSEEFVSEVVRIDEDVADIINERKDEFYEEYSYLKPECEKSWREKAGEWFGSAVDWCKDNWKSVCKIVAAVVIIVALGVATVFTGGMVGVLVAGAFWGALAGGLLGGIAGGIASARNGGSILDGIADGMLGGTVSGAITGAAFAGLGAAGSALGTYLGGACKFANCAGKILNVLNVTSKTTAVLSIGMGAFDSLAMVVGFFNPDSSLVALNEKLHSNSFYNAFQITVSAVAVFSGGAYAGMNTRMQQVPPACFVAGTLVLTAAGLVAIENVKVGDKVIATNPETFETAEKEVLETYIRKVPQLVHLVINKELIVTTIDHPFYVKEIGFVNAGELKIGEQLINSDGEICFVEKKTMELCETSETVYNLQVEDYHTYYVGESEILVHNADYAKQVRANAEKGKEFEKQQFEKLLAEEPDTVGQITIKVNETGERVRVDFASGKVKNGNAISPKLTEAKASSTATFTKNQQTGYPNLAKNGGVVVGKGKEPFVGGTQLPPTEVNVARPEGTLPLFSDILGSNLGGN